MAQCGQKAVLIVTTDVADTSTHIARRRVELLCGLELGHTGSHQDASHGEQWDGDGKRTVTLLRHEEPGA